MTCLHAYLMLRKSARHFDELLLQDWTFCNKACKIRWNSESLDNIELNTHNNWQYLFSPNSVAVIGASNTPGSWGCGIMMRLLDTAKRNIYPVNPTLSEVLGIAAYDSVVDIPDSIDLAVIVVPAPQVPTVLRECVQKRVRAAVIVSAGFAEVGDDGSKLEAELVNIARQGGIRFIGPNSLGFADTSSQISTLAWTHEIASGPVSLISQSGFSGERIIHNGMASGIGFSKFVSCGNEADLHFEDYLEYLAHDKNSRIITAYIEGLREGRRFFQLAKEITSRKPVIAIKAGGTKGSARAAKSHTGTLTGSDEVYTAAFRQAGVIRADDDDELCDVVSALLNQPLPRSNRVAILTFGGGPGVVVTEACEKAGLAIASLASSTIEKLDAYLPSRWSHGNPVDVAGMAASRRELVFSSLWTIMEDENVDAVLLQMPVGLNTARLSAIFNFSAEEARDFQEMQKENLRTVSLRAREFGKPVFVVTLLRDEESSSFLCREGVLAYHSPWRAVRALKHLVWYKHYLDTVDR